MGQLKRWLPTLALVLGAVPHAAFAQEAQRIVAQRGAQLEVIAEKPDGPGPFPAVVFASGAGYDMRQPILAETAQALLDQGIAVYRFDWAYRLAGADYSSQPKDRSAEIDDMRAVLALARSDPQIDSRRVAVAGKSLGSMVAWRVLGSDPALKGAILLTPPCSRPGVAEAAKVMFPELGVDHRPHLWVLGDIDPLCPVAEFHRFMAAGGEADRTAVVSGNHDYRDPADPGRDQLTLNLVKHLVTDFAARLLAQPPEK